MTHVLAKDLREAVLQTAIKGELTEQLDSDTPVNITINNIKTEKEKLLKQKKKKENSTSNDLINDIPFEIPDNWVWIELQNITKNINAGGDKPKVFSKEKNDICKYPVYSNGETNDGLFGYSNENRVQEKSITISGRGTIGFTRVREANYTPIVRLLVLTFVENTINLDYLQLVLTFLMKNGVGSAVKQLTVPMIIDKLIPLPPIEEQARIVTKVDELMAEIDEYEKLENQLVELKKNFPGDMKDAILQAAMEGKLTEQNLSEMITKIKSDSISDDYDTFDLSDNWQWNTINSVIDVTTGLTFNKLDQRTSGPNTLRVLRGGNILDNFNYGLFDNDVYVTYRDKHIPLKKNDVITPAVTSMEKMCKVGFIDKDLPNTTAGGFVYILRSKDTDVLNPRYMMYYFNSMFNRNNCNVNIHKSGQAFYNLKKSGMITQPIPLPPIEEQQRIVEKLDQLLPLVEGLMETYYEKSSTK